MARTTTRITIIGVITNRYFLSFFQSVAKKGLYSSAGSFPLTASRQKRYTRKAPVLPLRHERSVRSPCDCRRGTPAFGSSHAAAESPDHLPADYPRCRRKVLMEDGGIRDVTLVVVLPGPAQGNIQSRVTDISAAQHNAFKYRLCRILKTIFFVNLPQFIQLHIRGREVGPVIIALKKTQHPTVGPVPIHRMDLF